MSEGYWITSQEHARCEEERERLRAELDVVKALLRDAYPLIPFGDKYADDINERIRAALGGKPADDAPRKQP